MIKFILNEWVTPLSQSHLHLKRKAGAQCNLGQTPLLCFIRKRESNSCNENSRFILALRLHMKYYVNNIVCLIVSAPQIPKAVTSSTKRVNRKQPSCRSTLCRDKDHKLVSVRDNTEDNLWTKRLITASTSSPGFIHRPSRFLAGWRKTQQ